MTLLSAAKGLIKKGLSVVATDANKRAIVAWKPFTTALPTDKEITNQFAIDKAKGIAIICGQVSGNLEVIDVDTKYDITGTLFENLCSEIATASPSLFERLLIITTKSGGKHLYYRCSVIAGNQKLAQRPPTEEELKENPNEKVLVLIETRGEGGYVCSPPTPGYTKQSGDGISEITPDERDVLLTICRTFNQYIVEQHKPTVNRTTKDNFAVTPWEDYNKRGVDHMVTTLEAHGWTINQRASTADRIRFKRPGKTDSPTSGDYCHSKGLFMVFTTSSEFEPLKGYRPFAVFAKLEHRDDFKAAAKALSDSGYGEKPVEYDSRTERQLFQKKQDGYSREDLIKAVRAKDATLNAEEMVDNLEKKWGDQLCVFWDVEIDKDNRRKIHINRSRFIDFLHITGGFGLYFYDKASTIYRVVRMVDGFIEESSTEQMKKFILSYIENLPDTFDGGITPELLKELIMKQYNALFNESFLEFCPRTEPDFLKDEQKKAYFPFKNGVVVISQGKIEMVSYGSIKKYIWKSQVIDRNISLDQAYDPDLCEFYRFMVKISGDDEERLMYCMTLIGYLLHTYKDPAKPYSVIMAEETENESEGGGTGKGILVKAISYMVNTERVDGKNFKLDKNFAFQRVNLDTKLVSIEDVRKNVDFEGFFSIITEGITVEKKNKDELYIPFKDSPKILFTTNYTIANNSKAAQRRQKVFEFAPFFGPQNTPRDFFGHNLFDEWDEDEWNRFYNLMFACVDMYLRGGVKEVANSEKLKRKHIRLSFGEEALEWFQEYSGNGCAEWKPFKELYNNFMIENDFDKKEFSQKRFKKLLEIASQTFEKRVQTRRNRVQNNQHEIRMVSEDEQSMVNVLDNRVPEF
jgi:hypothetical protein